jgi:hypothetical protein
LFRGQQIQSWGGIGKGTQTIDGDTGQPYLSGHSTLSAAAEIRKSFTGSDTFNHAATIPAGSSLFEPGISRRYGGIHFDKATSTAAP